MEKEGNPGRNGADSPGGIAGRNFAVTWLEVEGGDVIADVMSGTRMSLRKKKKKGWGALAVLLGFCWAAISRACGGKERGLAQLAGPAGLTIFLTELFSLFQNNKTNITLRIKLSLSSK